MSARTDLEAALSERLQQRNGALLRVQTAGRPDMPSLLAIAPRFKHPSKKAADPVEKGAPAWGYAWTQEAMSVWVEIVPAGSVLSAEQMAEHEQLQLMGRRVVVVSSTDDFAAVLQGKGVGEV